MEKLNFLMGLHCHQPVDNFRYIFQDAYEKSYMPFLNVLEKHPSIKVSLHYSGPVLDWVSENRPEFLDKVRSLVERNQVEILTGGYFEPILSMVPIKDAKGQIEMLTDKVKKCFGKTPSGIWLTERVWDPKFSSIFKDLNIKYTILDDYHLKKAGVGKDEVFGHYSLKDNPDFHVFASIKKLRYTMPFREPNVTIKFLERLKEEKNVKTVTFGDDGEKFGLWPYTYDLVYKKGWLDKFFTKLEESENIKTLTFTEALKKTKSKGEVEIPHSSYAEMVQWSGGNFDNFFKKYPESDFMRRRMLNISKKIEELQGTQNYDSSLEKAKEELYKSQSNCAYWHGVFGGVYTSYLRTGLYSHIIKAGDSLKKSDKDIEAKTINLSDNKEDLIVAKNKFLNIFIDPSYAGSICEIDYKPLSYNLVNTISRRYEPYHEILKKSSRPTIESLKKKIDEEEDVNLYEALGVRERNLEKFLDYDPYRKFSFLCHVMDWKTTFNDFVKSRHVKEESLLGPFKHKIENGGDKLTINLEKDGEIKIKGYSYNIRLNKCIILESGSEIVAKFELENMSSKPLKFILGTEFNWSINDKDFMKDLKERGVREIALADEYCGIKINHSFGEPVDLWSFPVYTLNETECGLGKNFQELSLLFHKRVSLKSKGRTSFSAKVRISK